MEPRFFVATWALGHDYMPDLTMQAIFVLALLIGFLAKKVATWTR